MKGGGCGVCTTMFRWFSYWLQGLLKRLPRDLLEVIARLTKQLLEVFGGFHFHNAACNLSNYCDIVSVWQHSLPCTHYREIKAKPRKDKNCQQKEGMPDHESL